MLHKQNNVGFVAGYVEYGRKMTTIGNFRSRRMRRFLGFMADLIL
ncbi:hypothetical protein [Aliiroseovarius crassostreae]